MPIADQVRFAARVPFGVLHSCVTAVDRHLGPALSNAPVVGGVVARLGDALRGVDEKAPAEQPSSQPSQPSRQDTEPELEPATTAERETSCPSVHPRTSRAAGRGLPRGRDRSPDRRAGRQ